MVTPSQLTVLITAMVTPSQFILHAFEKGVLKIPNCQIERERETDIYIERKRDREIEFDSE